MWRAKKVIIFLFLPMLWGSVAHAATSTFSLLYPRPAFGKSDYLSTLGTSGLGRHQWRLSSGFDYSYHPLEVTGGGDRVRGVVDNLFVEHFEGAFAPSDWWEIELEIPVVWLNEFTAPVVPSPSPQNKSGVGDMLFRNRLSILRGSKHPVGLAVVPFVTLPTGNENNYMGDKYPTGGALAAIDADFGVVTAGLNLGFEARQHITWRDLDSGNLFLASGAVGVTIVDHLKGMADVYLATPIGHFFEDKVSTPAELQLGLKYALQETGITIDAGGGLSLVRAAGTPLFRTMAGLSYTGRPPKVKKLPLKPEDLAKVIELTMNFGFDSIRITDEAGYELSKIADVLMAHPGLQIVIIVAGHTDSKGVAGYNMQLSILRAKAVARYLTCRGVDQSRIKVEGFGETKPITDNNTAADRILNRRVEIRIGR